MQQSNKFFPFLTRFSQILKVDTGCISPSALIVLFVPLFCSIGIEEAKVFLKASLEWGFNVWG